MDAAVLRRRRPGDRCLCVVAIQGKAWQPRFCLLFAVAITVSVQLVGVYLVFTSLIVPALATAACSVKSGYGLALLIGISGYATGLIMSALRDLPSVAVIVWKIVLLALLIKLALPSKPDDR